MQFDMIPETDERILEILFMLQALTILDMK